jgi:hypothetical protein
VTEGKFEHAEEKRYESGRLGCGNNEFAPGRSDDHEKGSKAAQKLAKEGEVIVMFDKEILFEKMDEFTSPKNLKKS